MPEFIGGTNNLMAYLEKHVVYPDAALQGGIQGKVYVKFIIRENGKIDSVHILRTSGSPLLDSEAVRVVSIMPNWKPGTQMGKVVPVYFNLPINFKINGKYSDATYENPTDYFYNKGVKSSDAGDLEGALYNFDQCLSLNKNDIDALYNKGAIYLKIKDFEKACITWNKIKELGKHDADQLIMQYCSNKNGEALEIKAVEKMPEYPGGMEKLANFIQYNIKEPKGVKRSELKCNKVFVKFLIQADGKVADISITKGTGSILLDEEAKRLVSIMPNWIPATQNGKAVPIYFNLPIKFSNYNINCTS